MKLYTYILFYAFFGKWISGEEDISNLPDICLFPLALATMKETFC
jgi:hypothetical protein